MKTLSLWQPWATLIAIEAKRFETRSWSTKHRGLLAIHAAKKWDRVLQEYCEMEPFRMVLQANDHGKDGVHPLPLGAIVAIVKLADVQRVETVRSLLNPNEKAFGNYSDGRYAWKLELVKRLEKPIPINGAQGLFDVADDLILRFM